MANVPLREYLEALIRTQRETLEERLDAMDKALDIQTKEVARRLLDLNHAHERAKELQNTYVPRELYEKMIEEWLKWRSSVDLALARAAERKAVFAAMAVSLVALGGLIIKTIISLVSSHTISLPP